MNTRKISAAMLAGVVTWLTCTAPVLAQNEGAAPPDRTPDVIYVPTPQDVVDTMLQMAAVKPGEMVYDLGCGDGRIVISAARDFGALGIGVDIDPQRIAESVANAKTAGVTDRVQFKQADLFEMYFADADVVCLYLLPSLNVRLRPRILDELRPGTRIVSHSFDMGDWSADEQVDGGEEGQSVFFWVVPAKVAGEWKLALPGGGEGTLSLTQEFQRVNGTVTINGRTVPLADGRLAGDQLTFSFGSGRSLAQVTAKVKGSRFEAKIQRGRAKTDEAWTGELQP
jgi:SAM-dependent methyltransferase